MSQPANIFAFDWDRPVDEAERQTILSKIADNVVKRGLETPVTWFLEVHRPLAPLGAQLSIALSPYIAVWLKDGAFDLQKFTQLMRDPANITELIDMIDQRSASTDSATTKAPLP